MEDDPELDGTPFCHPAWLRGQDSGVSRTIQVVNDILDGKKRKGKFGSEEMNKLRDRLIKLTPKSGGVTF